MSEEDLEWGCRGAFKMAFLTENTNFLVLTNFGVLGCILQHFESKLADKSKHVTMPICLRVWKEVNVVPVSPATGMFEIF